MFAILQLCPHYCPDYSWCRLMNKWIYFPKSLWLDSKANKNWIIEWIKWVFIEEIHSPLAFQYIISSLKANKRDIHLSTDLRHGLPVDVKHELNFSYFHTINVLLCENCFQKINKRYSSDKLFVPFIHNTLFGNCIWNHWSFKLKQL